MSFYTLMEMMARIADIIASRKSRPVVLRWRTVQERHSFDHELEKLTFRPFALRCSKVEHCESSV